MPLEPASIATGRYDGSICIPGDLEKQLEDFDDKYGDDIAPILKALDGVLQLSEAVAAM